MKVTVIIPAWGNIPYLGEAIASVKAQTFADIELKVSAPEGEPHGALAARLSGVSESTGEWVMFLDADDTLSPEAVERLVAKADVETDVVVSGLIRGGEKRLWGADIWRTGPGDVFNCMCAKLFRRELFAGLCCDERVALGEDLLATAQLLHKARKVAVVEDAFYHYRENPTSLTHSLDGRKRVEDLMRVGEILRQVMIEPQFAEFHDRVTRDAMLLWCRYRLCDRQIWQTLESRLTGGLLDDFRHGPVKKGALYLAHCLAKVLPHGIASAG